MSSSTTPVANLRPSLKYPYPNESYAFDKMGRKKDKKPGKGAKANGRESRPFPFVQGEDVYGDRQSPSQPHISWDDPHSPNHGEPLNKNPNFIEIGPRKRKFTGEHTDRESTELRIRGRARTDSYFEATSLGFTTSPAFSEKEPRSAPRSLSPSLSPESRAARLLDGIDIDMVSATLTEVESPAGPPPGPHPSYIELAKPYIFQHQIDQCLKATGTEEAREDHLRLQGVSWIDNVRKALDL